MYKLCIITNGCALNNTMWMNFCRHMYEEYSTDNKPMNLKQEEAYLAKLGIRYSDSKRYLIFKTEEDRLAFILRWS